MDMKRLITIFLSLLLIFSIFTPMPNNAEAAIQSGSKLRVLEIVASGNSQIDNYLSKGNYQYTKTTMTMKKFVALREELDGKYDVIAIMDGSYTSTGVVKKEHNTSNVMNDITNLKANEIINDFINKGQPVIIHKDSINTGNKMKSNFGKYVNSNFKNVFIVSSSVETFWYYPFINYKYDDNGFNQFIKTGAYQQVPSYTLSQEPSTTKQYEPGQTLDFTMNVAVPADVNSRSLKAKLYIDSNFDDKYTTDEIMVEEEITSSSTNLSYQLPKGYSGVRYWKLELVDSANNLKSYEKGMVNFKGKSVDVKVLQVTNSSNASSLKTESNMKQSYLKRTGEYNIEIDVVNMATFNSSVHQTINGKYDMVIFGFADSYNQTAAINQTAADSVNAYINSKQSVMFTHDTIFIENNTGTNNWVKNFRQATGQNDPMTNLGYAAPNPATNTKIMNKGLITSYPFPIDKDGQGREKTNITIAKTHNQYFTLDLEDPDIISWYNIDEDSRDANDSWNHYYTYSKGNITYSGTGHTSTGFPDEEQRLFVNTMYRAFLGSNHAPEITVHTPSENQIIPTNQNIELSYTLQDYDMKDKKVSTKVFINDKLVLSNNDVTNGSTINESLRHEMPNGGRAIIKIQATDASGAVSEKVVNVTIQKITASLEVNRSVSVSNPVKTGEPIMITYTVTPKDITGTAASAIKTNIVNVPNLKLIETFPANLKVSSDGIQTGNEQTGIQLEKTLSNITYKKSGDKFIAEPMTFTVQVTPIKKGQYALTDSFLSYTDLTEKKEKPAFNSINFFADVALAGIKLPESYVLSKGSEKNFSIDLKMLPENSGIKEIVWSEESGGKNLTINPSTGVAKVIKEGQTTVKVKVTDNFGNVKEASTTVTVRIPVEEFTVKDMDIEIGQTLPLPITAIKPEDGKSSLEVWLADEPDNKKTASINKDDFTIKGLKEGTIKLFVAGLNSEGVRTEKTATITVKNVPVTNIIVTPNEVKIDKSEIFDKFTVTVEPSNATYKDVVWTSLSPTIASVLDNKKGIIQGNATGETTLEVTSLDGKVTTTVKVKVGQPMTSISIPTINLAKGETQKINFMKHPGDATNIIKSIKYEQLDTDYSVKLDESTGYVTGQREGQSKIKVTVTDEEGKTFTAEGIVKVSESGGSNSDDDKY
ncbi:DUF5057 domain-containing protein [Peribacillus psychrosaccharolyticus]|uniref:DUF5057 domain-containing protein n=2 Tax=Peribacillus psychrosaccharolyticus TaxID=1407 RepID=A0A974NL18_PERPY|nr:DUF5057 domain-containing protein [Peribacillus psychrosaccharolyticus]QQS99668.1 DUF5057 domain-containing protein [Peribacillus psychrosaccharolyticus]